MSLAGKKALVTGASRGIGKAVAIKLAAAGAEVIVTATSLERAKQTADQIVSLGHNAIPVKVDVGVSTDVEALFQVVAAEFGSLDILVNNAGITRDGLLMRMKDEDWDSVLDVNLKGTFLCTREAIKLMAKAKSGRIVTISSVVGEMGNAGQANYCASKAGIIGFTKAVAREYAKRNITVNAVAPGFIETDMTGVLTEGVKDELLKQIPVNRFGTPEDIANAVYYLVSDLGSYVTGQVIAVNGGMHM
ncbi:MAG: 3-oxoacyl-[acyl-carrier-protein] reductase [Deltaproteobacteria bacterium]|nr:3-oxoacyl-[acyl-carrier-protein] reductase [Deltaproteobacteria bacterium]TLN04753.1 MAG: 3-oxoacyl-[acyl-carrier-protein] reductase [bacterium]